MIENYIADNLNFLVRTGNLSQDDFGNLFDLNRGVIGQYIRRQSTPKIETIQRICAYYNISIDNFVNRKLEDLPKSSSGDQEPESNKKYVELLEKSLQDKEEIIAALRERLAGYESGTRKRPA